MPAGGRRFSDLEVLVGMADEQVETARSRAGSCVEFDSIKAPCCCHMETPFSCNLPLTPADTKTTRQLVSEDEDPGPKTAVGAVAGHQQSTYKIKKRVQLRKWQQHMQEQLKAHQLEEMLQLQDEQQRLLGIVNGSKPHKGVSSELSGAEWDEDELHPRPEMNSCEEPQRTHGLQQQLSPPGEMEELFKDQDYDEESMWNSREENQEQSADMRRFLDNDDTMQPEGVSEGHSRREENILLERPIRPGIGAQKQTFEELLEEQLRLEEQKLKSAQQQQRQNGAKAASAPPKRAFLKRGEGLSRFTNKASSQKVEKKKEHNLQSQAGVISHRNSASASIQKGGLNRSLRLPVQRKTATLNKENRAKGLSLPPQGSKAAWTKVLCGHQRQNTDGLESVKTDPELGKTKQHLPEQIKECDNRQVGQSIQALTNCGPNKHCNPVTKQVGTCGGSEKTDSNSTNERTQLSEGGGVSRDSFELSFQEKLRHWECNKQLENMELGEFELLEQAAEELSFSSNSSFVTKILQMDQQNRQLEAARGLHQRRLSSTPIKSPSRGEPQKCCRVQCSDALSCKIVSVDSGVSVKMRADTSRNKVGTENEDAQDSEREDKPEVSDVSSGGGSEFGDEEVVVRGTICFPAQSNPPYDKRSYEDEDSLGDSTSDVPQEENEESDGVLSNEDDSTLIEDKDTQQGRVVFDDDDTWNDLEDTAISKVGDSREISPVSKSTASTVSPTEKTLLRKVAVRKAVMVDEEPDPPPASQLMTRLFPSLKPKAQKAPVPPPPAESASNKSKDDSGQQVQSTQLRERLVELEIEIERFKKENVALTKLREENEKKHEDLRKERTQFEQIKAEELAKFEEYKKEENRELQKERKLFEKYASAARAIPDKKEREEIQSLKQQLSALQEELKRRESRWGSTHNRLRQQIDSLNKENRSLRDEIKMLEKLRLSAWKKSSVSAENDIERKDGRRTLDNSSPPVTKGVTFASPLDSTGSGCKPPQSSGAAATRTSKDSSQGAAGMKSSLKTSSGSASSSSLSDRRENNPTPPSDEQEKPLNHQHMESCPAIEKVLADGDRLIIFPNGTRKEVSADGLSAKVTFFNGDTKQITADQRVIYYYAEAQTTHITYPDGLEVLHFPNNQTEKHFPDGHKEITFPDQTVKNLFPDGREESVLTDGTIIQVNPDGTKEIHFNTGQKEIHTADFKRREYPDGTVKTVYADGRQETCYPTGRLRVKDKDGNVILDSCRNARET